MGATARTVGEVRLNSNELTRSHREHFGRGAGNVKTVIQKGRDHLPRRHVHTNRETLTAGGHTKLVMDARFALMRDTYVGIIERVPGRSVRAFLSRNHIDPAIPVEMFVLDAEGGDDVPTPPIFVSEQGSGDQARNPACPGPRCGTCFPGSNP